VNEQNSDILEFGNGALSTKLFSFAVLSAAVNEEISPKFEALNPKRFGHLIIRALSLFRV
jgi:hypothetical protein